MADDTRAEVHVDADTRAHIAEELPRSLRAMMQATAEVVVDALLYKGNKPVTPSVRVELYARLEQALVQAAEQEVEAFRRSLNL